MSGNSINHILGVMAYVLAGLYIIYPFFRQRKPCRSCQCDTTLGDYTAPEGRYFRYGCSICNTKLSRSEETTP